MDLATEAAALLGRWPNIRAR